MPVSIRTLTACIGLLLVAAPVFGQPQGGEITGRVVDPAGTVMPNVELVLSGQDSTLTRTTATDGSGVFAFAGLPAGSYALVGSFPGLRLIRLSDLAVTAGRTLDLGDLVAQVAAQEQVVIVGGVRGSLASSLTRKRTSDNLVDGITADDVADFPDLNISESLQRVTGVSINRVLGEGQQVTVRGLAPEFTRVTINGQTVASGNPGREIDFDVFASELFTAVNLSKTPTASLTEGGLAATIDLRTARPFDFDLDRPTVAFSGQFSQNQLRGEGDPRISGLASSTFLDGRLGLLGSVSYSESSLRQDNAEGLRFLLTDIDVQGDGVNEFSNVEIPFIPRYVLELLDRKRLGVTAALQLNPSPRFDLNLDVAYARFDETRTRYSIDGLLTGNRTMPVGLPTVDATGLVTRATYDNVSSRSENIRTPSEEDFLLVNLDAAWYLNTDWILRAKTGYSDAAKDAPEFRSVWQSIDTFTFEWTGQRIFPGISSANTDYTNPLDFSANQSRFLFTGVTDRDWSAQGDLERFFSQSGFLRSLQFGARFSDGKKTQQRRDGRISFPTGRIPPSAAIAAALPVDDFFGQSGAPQIVRTWFVTDFDAVNADPLLTPDGYMPPERFISNYAISERTLGGYAQLNVDGGPVRGNVGVRVVGTDQTSNGFLADGTPLTQSQSYQDVLPSANLVFQVGDETLIRVAASRSLTRPTLSALSPGGIIAPTGLTARLGNPELSPFSANQIDTSFEWYFADEALASFTWFFKDVDGFITNVSTEGKVNAGTLVNDLGEDVSDATFLITRPVNGEAATIQGVEASIQAPFSFLPAPLDGLGALANFTWATSESTIQFNQRTVTTRLPGQSRSSYNLVGYYEKGPFSGRVVYSWRDDYLHEVRPSQRQRSNFIADYGQLDMSLQYDFTGNLAATFDALNLLEAEEQRFGERLDRNVRYTEWGRFVLFGIKVNY